MVDVDVVDGIGDAVAVPGTDQFIVQPNAHEPLDDMPRRLTVYPFGTTRAIASGPLAGSGWRIHARLPLEEPT